MKTSYGIILVLAVATTVLLTAAPACRAAEKEEGNIWLEDEPRRGHRRLKLTEEKIERVMNRLKEADPEKAKELAQLKEKDPEKFKAELKKVMHKRFGKRFRGRKGQRAGRECRPVQKCCPAERCCPVERCCPAEKCCPAQKCCPCCPVQDKPCARRGPGGYGKPAWGREKGTFRERLWQKHAEHLEWLGENCPEEAKRLAKLKEKKPEHYMRELWRSKKRCGRIAEAEKENPKLAEVLKEDLGLKKKRDKLLRKIRAASDDEKKELIGQLEEVVGGRFDLIVKRKQMGYERLCKKLERVKERVGRSQAEVEKWKEVRSEEIKKRLEKLIRRTEKFDWD